MAEMGFDLARPARRNRIMPIVDASAIILAIAVARRQVELHHPRRSIGQHIGADLAPEIGQTGLPRRMAKKGEHNRHGAWAASEPNRMMAVAVTLSPPSCSASFAMVVWTKR